MSIKSQITDPATGRKANVVDGDEINALVVATRPLKQYENSVRFFVSPSFGADMNIGVVVGVSGSLEELIYEDDAGTPTEWDTSIIVGGGWDFASAAQVYSGTTSIDGTSTTHNDTMQLARASALDLSGYVAVEGAIYITSWSTQGTKAVNITGWDTVGGAVGATVDIGNYVDTGSLNMWQIFTIPLADMSLTGASVDAFRIATIDIGTGVPPDFYLDLISLPGTGVSPGDSAQPEDFVLEPTKGTWLHVHTIHFTMVDEYEGTLADATMPSIPYDGFLGLGTLTRGLNYRRIQLDGVVFSLILRDFIDIMSLPGARISGSGSDGVFTWVSMSLDLTEPIVLKSEDFDRLILTVQDNLAPLTFMRVSAGCKVEERPLH